MLSLALFSALLAPNAPVAEGYHYILVLPSLLVGLWHVQHQARDWRAWLVPLLAALLIGAPLPYTSRRLQGGWLALVAYPRVYGAYLLWAWLGWRLATLRGRCPRRLSADQRLTTGDGL
jgi:disulfide bond formation protein DsbB